MITNLSQELIKNNYKKITNQKNFFYFLRKLKKKLKKFMKFYHDAKNE